MSSSGASADVQTAPPAAEAKCCLTVCSRLCQSLGRKEVIESYRTILTRTGDVSRGREIFKKNCATCHQIQVEGHRVGPELTGLRTRNKEALLMDVLDSNRALEPNYAEQAAEYAQETWELDL